MEVNRHEQAVEHWLAIDTLEAVDSPDLLDGLLVQINLDLG